MSDRISIGVVRIVASGIVTSRIVTSRIVTGRIVMIRVVRVVRVIHVYTSAGYLFVI